MVGARAGRAMAPGRRMGQSPLTWRKSGSANAAGQFWLPDLAKSEHFFAVRPAPACGSFKRGRYSRRESRHASQVPV